MSIINISIPKYLRQQIDDLVEQGVVATVSEAARLGLIMFISREKLQRWDDEVYYEHGAGILKKDRVSGVLISRQFQKDLNRLVKEVSELRRVVSLTFKRLVHHFFPDKQTDVFLDKSLKIKPLKLYNYFFADFELGGQSLRILLRRQGEQVIVCKMGYTADYL